VVSKKKEKRGTLPLLEFHLSIMKKKKKHARLVFHQVFPDYSGHNLRLRRERGVSAILLHKMLLEESASKAVEVCS